MPAAVDIRAVIVGRAENAVFAFLEDFLKKLVCPCA